MKIGRRGQGAAQIDLIKSLKGEEKLEKNQVFITYEWVSDLNEFRYLEGHRDSELLF